MIVKRIVIKLIGPIVNLITRIYLLIVRQSRVSGIIKNALVGSYVKIKNGLVIDAHLSENVQLRESNIVTNASIGRYTYLQRNSMVTYATVGAFCSIAENVRIGATNHDLRRFTTHEITFNHHYGYIRERDLDFTQKLEKEMTVVGHDVWIGYGAIVMPGVKVGHGAVIGAGSIVTHDVPSYAIVVGNPAKIIRFRFDDETIQQLLRSKWWDWPKEQIVKQMSYGIGVQDFLEGRSKE